jgi:carbon-monoxide dehydrogenase small subunit
MTMSVILNGEDVEVKTDMGSRLVNILRDNFGLLGTRLGCLIGKCGQCSLVFNGDVVKSCLIPAFKIRGSEIITIEGFSQTDEYQDIIQGFAEAKVESCGFCNTSKILTVEALLSRNQRPGTKEEILPFFAGIDCRCTEPEEIVRGVISVAEHRRRRFYGRS